MNALTQENITWDNVWNRNQKKNSYALTSWRNERADDKIGYFIQSGMTFRNNETVLDAGCGDGSILFAIKKHFDVSIIGIDFSQEAINQTLNNSFKYHTKIETHQADTRKLPFATNSIDKIFSLGVIEHLKDSQTAVNELARCLKPGGMLVLMTPNKFSLGRFDRVLKTFFRQWNFGYQKEFSSQELVKMIISAGLSVSKAESIKRKRFVYDSFAFKLIHFVDSLINAILPACGFYSYVFATKTDSSDVIKQLPQIRIVNNINDSNI